MRQDRLHESHGAEDVHFELRAKSVDWHLFDGANLPEAGVVHETVDAVVALYDGLDDTPHLLVVGDVEGGGPTAVRREAGGVIGVSGRRPDAPPASRNRRAVARPIPEEQPVTRTTGAGSEDMLLRSHSRVDGERDAGDVAGGVTGQPHERLAHVSGFD